MPLPLSRTLTAGTNENINDVQLNFNDLANAFPVQATNIGDGQITTAKLASAAVSPKKMLTVAHVSAVSSYTFSGLNGNADYGYELVFLGATSATSDPVFFMRPNNDTTAGNYNNVFTRCYHNPAVTSGQDYVTIATGLHLHSCYSAGGAAATHGMSFRAQLHAKVIGSTFRTSSGNSGSANASNSAHTAQNSAGFWNNTADNITSLVVLASLGTFTGMLTLRKLGEV